MQQQNILTFKLTGTGAETLYILYMSSLYAIICNHFVAIYSQQTFGLKEIFFESTL